MDDNFDIQETMNEEALSTAQLIIDTLFAYTGGESHTRDGHIAKIQGYMTLINRGDGDTSHYREMLLLCVKMAMKWMSETGRHHGSR